MPSGRHTLAASSSYSSAELTRGINIFPFNRVEYLLLTGGIYIGRYVNENISKKQILEISVLYMNLKLINSS